jgi:hypothetical protein
MVFQSLCAQKKNIRFYDDQQLRKFLNVVSLKNAGGKISKIVDLSELDFNNQITDLIQNSTPNVKEDVLVNQLISSGLTYDEVSFEKAFSNSILVFGVLGAYQRVLYPALVRIGLLWTISRLSISQEHFVTSLFKQKILSAIDSLDLISNSKSRWILFLPEGEIHSLGLMIANYALKKRGAKVIYLGKNVDLDSLSEVSKSVYPTHYLFFVVRHNQTRLVNKYLNAINNQFESSSCYVCCDSSFKDDFTVFESQRIVSSFEEFIDLIDLVCESSINKL